MKVTNPKGQVFYTRFKLTKGKVKLPPSYQEKNGFINFSKGAAYELEGIIEGILKEAGIYKLSAVYGAAPQGETEIGKGLIESQPVKIEVK